MKMWVGSFYSVQQYHYHSLIYIFQLSFSFVEFHFLKQDEAPRISIFDNLISPLDNKFINYVDYD